MNDQASKRPARLPLYAWILFGIAALSLVLLLIATASERFANAFNGSVGAVVRALLAHLTSWLPFSLAEILLYAVPPILVAVGIYAYRRHCESWRTCLLYLVSLVSVFSLFFSLFVFSFGTGYHTTPLPERMGFETGAVSKEDLHATTAFLIEACNREANEVSFGEDGFAQLPYSRRDLNERLLAAYETVIEEYDFIQSLDSRVKPVLASKAMSYTHITGVYSYFTGEANVNVYFPDYTLPFTMAHEMAHQRGIAREDEANFVAFLVCAASEDAFIRYSGYRTLFEYTANAYYRTDKEPYFALLESLDDRVMRELDAYAEFFAPFSGSLASKISGTVNDSYLKLHGNEAGTASYGMVVDLAVAYLSDKTEKVP